MRTLGLGAAVVLMLAVGAGCGKPAGETAKAPAPATNPPVAQATNQVTNQAAPPLATASLDATVARLHWLGKKRLATETNAAQFMTIWNLPESARLEAQTLDKLALAIGHWQAAAQPGPVTNFQSIVASLPAAALVRPLLNDVVQEESYLELRQTISNQVAELALALKLSAEQDAVWQAAITNTLFPLSNRCELVRAGDWTVLGMCASTNTPTNSLLSDFVARLKEGNAPSSFEASMIRPALTNAWVEADVDLARVAGAWGWQWKSAPELPRFSLAVYGDGTNARTRAELEFPKPLGLELDAWNIPTGLIREPLVGFTALRGIRPWVKSLKLWNKLQLGEAPNQAYFWAQSGGPSLHFAAAPVADAGNKVGKFIDYVVQDLNPLFAASGLGIFQRTNVNRMAWRGIPVFSPSLEVVNPPGGPFILGGYAVHRGAVNPPAPATLLAQVKGSTNLVWYDWELTHPCLQSMTTLSQLTRHLFNQPRLSPEQAGLPWFFAIAYRLGNTVTTLNATSPTHLSLLRKSTLGLTAIELQVLVDWLESPTFPADLATFRGLATTALGGSGTVLDASPVRAK